LLLLESLGRWKKDSLRFGVPTFAALTSPLFRVNKISNARFSSTTYILEHLLSPPSTPLASATIFTMPSRKEKLSDKAVAVTQQGDALAPASKLPPLLRFPLVVLLSLTLSSLLHSIAAQYTAGDLARVSRSLDQWWEVGVLAAWRT
jgi:hypothetical protein